MRDKLAGREYYEYYKDILPSKVFKENIISLFDNHHITPISLFGHDLQHNIVNIWRPLHNHIHDVLNIPMNNYSSSIRKIKKMTNHKLIHSLEGIEAIHDLQKNYFKKVETLPSEAISIHENKMFETVQRRQKQAEEMVQYNKMESPESFHDMHDHQYEVHKLISTEIYNTLKKKFYYKK